MGLQRERGPPFGAWVAVAAWALCSPTNGHEQESAPASEPQGEYEPSELEGFVRLQLAEAYTPDDLLQLANRESRPK